MTSQIAREPIERGEPLREAVYTRIVRLICSGEYAPGAPLTEAGLSRMLDVSRTPVREGLLRLEAEGVLRSTPARGFTVRPLDRLEAAELYPILASLEALAVRSIIPSKKPTLQALRQTMRKLIDCDDPVRRWQLDTTWHDLIIEASGNGQLIDMIKRLRVNLSRYELAYMREVASRREADGQHAEITKALNSGGFDRAAELLEKHWHDGMVLILRWLDRG